MPCYNSAESTLRFLCDTAEMIEGSAILSDFQRCVDLLSICSQSIDQLQVCHSVHCIINQCSLKSRHLNMVPEEHDSMAVVQNNGQRNRAVIQAEVDNDSGFSSGGFSSLPDPKADFDRLGKNRKELMSSGFYYPSLDQGTAMKLLKRAKAGSFLVRDSSHPGFLYAVSVKTPQGATSVRISYADWLFGFDGDEEQPSVKPRFDSVVALMDYYAQQKRRYDQNLTMRGKSDRKAVQIEFTKPVRKTVPSLAHLARLKINTSIDSESFYDFSVESLPLLPGRDKQFLRNYPYRS